MPGIVLGTFGDENITHTHISVLMNFKGRNKTQQSSIYKYMSDMRTHTDMGNFYIRVVKGAILITFMNCLHDLSELSTGKGNLVK